MGGRGRASILDKGCTGRGGGGQCLLFFQILHSDSSLFSALPTIANCYHFSWGAFVSIFCWRTDSIHCDLFEKGKLGRIFGTKRDNATGGRGKLHFENLHHFYCSPSTMIEDYEMGGRVVSREDFFFGFESHFYLQAVVIH
jgi:hypothetical protein